MRAKLLRADNGGTVLLVYPQTRKEYGRALRAVERLHGVAGRGGHDAGREGFARADGGGVVTTVAQRERWGLADLTTCGQARVVDEAQVLGLLVDPSAGAEAVDEALPDGGIEAGPPQSRDEAASALADVRALVAPGADIDQTLGALEGAGLPHRVRRMLRCALREALKAEADALDDVLLRTQMVLAMPWRARETERFDRAQLKQALDRTHGALDKVKNRIVDVLASCPQARGPLCVEGVRGGRATEPGRPPPLVVRPGPGPVLCLAGPRGTGKRSLAVSIAEALGRTRVHLRLNDGNPESLLRGVRNGAPGRIACGLHDAGVANPAFILDALDRVDPEDADALSGVLDPARRKAFRDEYLDAAFDLSATLWIVTATDPAAIPPAVQKYLELVVLPEYGEEEKVAIAEGVPAQTPVRPVLAAAVGMAGGRAGRAALAGRAGPVGRRSGRGRRARGLVGAGDRGIVGGTAAARRRRGVAHGRVHGSGALRAGGGPPPHPPPRPRGGRGRVEEQAGNRLPPRRAAQAGGGTRTGGDHPGDRAGGVGRG